MALRGEDPEGVHQVRVAAGRLAAWLALARRRVLRDDLSWLRRTLGPVRDLDVLISAHRSAAWLPVLEREREERRKALREALRAEGGRFAGLVAALRDLPPVEGSRARGGLEHLRRRLERAGEALGDDPTLEALHRVRRRLRRLRYGYEWLGEKRPDLEELQAAFGELNDLAIAHRRLVASGIAPPGDARRARIEQGLEQQRAAAVEAWARFGPGVLER